MPRFILRTNSSCIIKIIAKYGEINESSPALILQEKKQIIQQTQLLEFCLTDKSMLI